MKQEPITEIEQSNKVPKLSPYFPKCDIVMTMKIPSTITTKFVRSGDNHAVRNLFIEAKESFEINAGDVIVLSPDNNNSLKIVRKIETIPDVAKPYADS